MRNLIVVAVVMLAASMLVVPFATAADRVPFEETRSSVTGWGSSYQFASQDAQNQLYDIEIANPGYWCKVTGFDEGEYEGRCWHTKFYVLKECRP